MNYLAGKICPKYMYVQLAVRVWVKEKQQRTVVPTKSDSDVCFV